MRQWQNRNAFTLVELLVVVGIIAILVAAAFPLCRTAIQHANCSSCTTHMRSLGIAFLSYANDNDEQLPGRVTSAGADKWPVLLQPYVPDPKNYIDPGDPVAVQVPVANLISNNGNNSSFFFNGFNDLGAYDNQNVTVRINSLTNSSSLMLLGQKVQGSTQYYMDFVEGNQDDVLNKQAYFGGSNYVFADGSANFITLANYNDTMWLVNQSYPIPAIPPGH